jgi:hypothetical protein
MLQFNTTAGKQKNLGKNRNMEVRFQNSPQETKRMGTEELRKNFLIEDVMVADEIKLVYSHYDRVIIGGAKPVNKALVLETHPELRAEHFLERRELGIINIGGNGVVEADGELYNLSKLDCLYLGKGVKSVSFSSGNPEPLHYFICFQRPLMLLILPEGYRRKKLLHLLSATLLHQTGGLFTNTYTQRVFKAANW